MMRDQKEKDFFAAAMRVWNIGNRVLEFYQCGPEDEILAFDKLRLALVEICRREKRGIEGIEHLRTVGETSEQLRRFKDRTRVEILESGKQSALLFEEWLSAVFPEAYRSRKSKLEWN
jgi:hypothetical protein